MDYASFIKKLDFPARYTPPTQLVHDDIIATAITRSHLQDDVRGINASLDLIRRTRGGRWPTEAVTEEGNYADLVWHEVEFRDATSLTYAVYQSEGPVPRLLLPLPDGTAHRAIRHAPRP